MTAIISLLTILSLLTSLVAAKLPRLIVGVNKYSHDTSICIVDAVQQKILFSQAKERITGRKHDGGGISALIKYGLDYIQADMEDIHTVVSNNHHFRVRPFEVRLPFALAMNSVPGPQFSSFFLNKSLNTNV